MRLTHPDKVLYPAMGVTKRELAEYLLAMADRILPHAANRPVSLVRCPEGQARACFFQRHRGAGTPEGFKSIRIPGKDKEPYLYIEDARGLLAAAQIGVLELHLWGARIDDIEHPDRLVFDLDPDPSVAFPEVRRAARLLRGILESAGLECFPLLTGGKGLHVVAPLQRRNSWEEVQAFCKGVAEAVVADEPDKYTAKAAKALRPNRIFIDWLRNLRGASAVAPYSTRAREGCPVAVPVAWSELGRLAASDAYDIRTVGRRLAAQKADPWKDYFRLRQRLPRNVLGLFR
jgi:bifunctional non-homologous end joining protein LigD